VKISETLYKAADHIDQNGWYQGWFWPGEWVGVPPYVDGEPCCMLGAIHLVEGSDPERDEPPAMQYLADHLGMRYAAAAAAWNDMSHRTKDEVLVALRGAAERAERAGR